MMDVPLTAIQTTRVIGANDLLLSDVLQSSNRSHAQVTGVCDIWDPLGTPPHSIEGGLESGQDFLVRCNTSFGTSINSFLKFLGVCGTMDAAKCGDLWLPTGKMISRTSIHDGGV